jgi:hypothetical protein
MLDRYNLVIFIALLFIIASCGKPVPKLENFDQATWKSDRKACLDQRMAMAASLEAQRSKMLALDEMAIVSLLGNPDQNELYTRNQKFYTYFLQPGPDCAANTIPGDRDTAPKKLVIRFNAMGLAKEIIVE